MTNLRTHFVATCHKGDKGFSATISELPERIIYVGLNPHADAEAAALDRATRRFGGVVAAYPKKTEGKTLASGLDLDLHDDATFERFLAELIKDSSRRDRLRVALSAVTDEQRRKRKDSLRCILGRLAQIFTMVEAGKLRVRRMVLSSHASRTEFFDDNTATYTTDDLLGIAEVFPSAARSIRHLMISGCFTGYTDTFEIFRRIFPNLATVWAYFGKSPSGELKKGSPSVTHMLDWESQTRPQSAQRIDRRRIHEPASRNVAVWSKRFGADPSVRPLDVVEKDVANHLAVYNAAFAGAPYSEEELLSYYRLVNELCGHPLLPPESKNEEEKKVTRVLLLRFYPKARQNFARYYRRELERGYAAIGRPLPPYGKLSRKDALDAIDALENAVIAGSLDLPPATDAALKILKDHLLRLDMPRSWAEGGER